MNKMVMSLLLGTVFASAMGCTASPSAAQQTDTAPQDNDARILIKTAEHETEDKKEPAFDFSSQPTATPDTTSFTIGSDQEDDNDRGLKVPKQVITPFIQSPVRK